MKKTGEQKPGMDYSTLLSRKPLLLILVSFLIPLTTTLEGRLWLRKIRFHDLRHSFSTLLISQGENVKFVQSQLGHASIQTTIDRYGHLFPESYKEVGKRLEDTVGIGRQSEYSVRKLLEKAF